MKQLLEKFFFSTRLMAVLFVTFAIAMACGTFIESIYSTDTARIWVYNATWFEAIMVFFVINFSGNIFRYKLLRKEKWPVLLLHLSWVLIMLGAFVTRYISFEGVMPIREGNSEKVFYSDKTFLTVLVDGEIDGVRKRRKFQDGLIVTTEALKSNLPWKYDFNGQEFTVSYVDFINGAKKGLIPSDSGNSFLKIVEAGEGTRHEHFLENGTVASIHNVLFALNKETSGAINLYITDSTTLINSPFEGDFMRMADQFKGTIVKDSLQTFQMRSLYNTAGMQFVIPDPMIKGVQGIVEVPESEKATAPQDALVLEISSNGKTMEKKILGGKGSSNFSDQFTLGGLDFTIAFGSRVYDLPFSIKLNDFIAEKYPGTEKGYASFMSRVTVEDERPFDYDIYMNHVLDNGGYRFFQAKFDNDEKGTTLSVSHDFWGKWITYTGYTLLYIGLISIMFFGKTRFRELGKSLQKIKAKKAALTLLLFFGLVFNTNAQEEKEDVLHQHERELIKKQIDSVLRATIVDKKHAEKFGALVIQDDGGRMKPINTFASELLRKISLNDSYGDLDANQVFLSMMMNRNLWYNIEFIKLERKNDSIGKILGVKAKQKYVRFIDFFDEKGNHKLGPYLEKAYSTSNPDMFQKEYRRLDVRLGLINRSLSGEIIKIFPLLNDENNKWISALEFRSGKYHIGDTLYANFVKNALPYYLMTLQKAKVSGDYKDADKLLAAFKQNQENHGKEVLPSENKIQAEILYNKINIFNKLKVYYGLFGGLMFFFVIFQIFKDRKILHFGIKTFKVIIIGLFVVHTAGLIVRWYISGHAPWTDSYESIIYIAWATMGMGILFGRKSDMTTAATAFVVTMLLTIASWNWIDPEIANLQPVLDSYWVLIHVSIIVASYGPLTVGMILGLVSLVLIILTTKKNKAKMELNLKELTIINELVLTLGLVMLTIGNFLGGQWANESWGRYWGWDPKETWALISIMVYAFIIHMSIVPGLRSKWLFNFASLVGFATIMMTYFGVNFYLAGLHSYASGTDVITPAFIWYAAISAAVLGAISFWRYKVHYSK
ncbi:MAG: cytochrome c biogenesis protein CcsA [Cellulophaga sp.]